MREGQARLSNAKALRTSMTDAEQKLWYHLRGHRLSGHKFKRQVRLGRYVVDFACLEHKLVVELDGGQHAEAPADAVRDAWLRNEGYAVLRFWNNQALQETEAVMAAVLAALNNFPLPNP